VPVAAAGGQDGLIVRGPCSDDGIRVDVGRKVMQCRSQAAGEGRLCQRDEERAAKELTPGHDGSASGDLRWWEFPLYSANGLSCPPTVGGLRLVTRVKETKEKQ